jgi:hypothetical protein
MAALLVREEDGKKSRATIPPFLSNSRDAGRFLGTVSKLGNLEDVFKQASELAWKSS